MYTIHNIQYNNIEYEQYNLIYPTFIKSSIKMVNKKSVYILGA